MALSKIDLILHPVRLRILQTLYTAELSTRQIAAKLADVPTSSIYRHLRQLNEAGLVTITKTEPVRGTAEKFYQIGELPTLSAADMATATADMATATIEEQLGYFATFMLVTQQGFAAFMQAHYPIDHAQVLMGYREAVLFGTKEELMTCFQKINEAVAPLLQNEPAAAEEEPRIQQKLITITHPI